MARDLTLEQEREVIQKTTAMIEKRTGKRPVGWRSCTQSPNSLQLLMEVRIWEHQFDDDEGGHQHLVQDLNLEVVLRTLRKFQSTKRGI